MKKESKKTAVPDDDLEIIDTDAILSIKMSTSYFNRIQMLYHSLVAEKTPAELQNAYDMINNKKIDKPWVYNLETLGILIKEFQKVAKAEGKVKKISKEDYEKLIANSIKT